MSCRAWKTVGSAGCSSSLILLCRVSLSPSLAIFVVAGCALSQRAAVGLICTIFSHGNLSYIIYHASKLDRRPFSRHLVANGAREGMHILSTNISQPSCGSNPSLCPHTLPALASPETEPMKKGGFCPFLSCLSKHEAVLGVKARFEGGRIHEAVTCGGGRCSPRALWRTVLKFKKDVIVVNSSPM